MNEKAARETVGGAWAEFERTILDPIHASATQREEMRRAFYGGALVIFGLVLIIAKNYDEDEAEKRLDAIDKEFDDYHAGLQAQAHPQQKPIRGV